MTFEELKEKARSLPLAPGVYLMHAANGEVIYVGKAKKLRNRVSQYFQDAASHTPKTRKMVSQVATFETIVASSEFEALVLECSLIKRYMPKYNILLKDDKGYPYLRLDLREPYPELTLVSRIAEDGADYFGPYGGRSVTQRVIRTLLQTFQLPACSRRFPQDIGKGRVCLYHHMGTCAGWCRGTLSQQEFHSRMEQIAMLLRGRYESLTKSLREEMELAAERLEFERAAALRDRYLAIQALGEKQLVTAGTLADTDAVGYYQNENHACIVWLHITGGNLLDKDYELLPPQDDPQEAVSSLIKQFYLSRGAAPKQILLPMEIEDAEPFTELLLSQLSRRVHIRVPQRGEGRQLVTLANQNAREECERITTKEERLRGTLEQLSAMLSLPSVHRLEAYDISNTAGTDIVASMVVFEDGKPKKSDYKRFRIEDLTDQDDYASMRQTLHRRFAHYLAGDAGFSARPDALLIDGGAVHAEQVKCELAKMGISIPIFGMVKDNRHRTRALVTPERQEIGISTVPPVFALIGRIQEETHRFAITYHKSLQSKRLGVSQLDEIAGIGEKRKAALLKQFKTISAIRAASLAELQAYLPRDAANAVYSYFHKEKT